jgi:hypothetical protein
MALNRSKGRNDSMSPSKTAKSRSHARRARDERGSSLILALIYIVSVSLIVGALADWTMNDLNNTRTFQSASSLEYAATSATQVAIQSIRYTPLYSETASNIAPGIGYCWTPASGSYLSQLNNFNGFNVTVWCSTVENLASANTRKVSFYACKTPSPAPTNITTADADGLLCSETPLLYAQVAYDDYLPGATTLSSTCVNPNCGYGATELQWTWGASAGAANQSVNAITVTSTAPTNAIVGGATYTANAIATSGDAVVVTSAAQGVCTVAGTTVTMVGVGQCVLDFNDNGNLNFAPAPQQTQQFLVTASTAGTYSGSTNNVNIPSGNNYYLINGTSTASSTSTANAYTPGTGTTLTKLTFTLVSSSPSTVYTATVDTISGSTVTASALTCSIPVNQTTCSITASVSVSSTNSINVDASGNGSHAGSWAVTYTQP